LNIIGGVDNSTCPCLPYWLTLRVNLVTARSNHGLVRSSPIARNHSAVKLNTFPDYRQWWILMYYIFNRTG